MVCHGSHGGLAGKVRDARMALINGGSAGMGELLPPEAVQRAVEAERVWFRECLFTPLVTLWTFLFQVLDADGSCRAAVARLLALLAARGEAGEDQEDDDGGEPATGPYCKARQRLPESLIARLAKEAGGKLHAGYPAGRLLGGKIKRDRFGKSSGTENQAGQVRFCGLKARLGRHEADRRAASANSISAD